MHSQPPEQQPKRQRTGPINPCWTQLTEGSIHAGIRRVVVWVGTLSATYPLQTVALTCLVSLSLLIIGYFTNFQLELNQLHFVTPTNSLPDIHSKWIRNAGDPSSGFPNVRVYYLNIHNQGQNVLHSQAMEVALEAMEVLQSTTNYHELCQTCSDCSESDKDMLYDGKNYCRISSVTQFWDHSLETYQNALANITMDNDRNDYVRQVVSHPTFPDGTPVYHEAILGKYEGYNTTSGDPIDYTNAPALSLATLMETSTASSSNDNELYLTSAQCLAIKLDIPDVGSATDDFEHDVLERLGDLQEKYQTSSLLSIQLEYFTMNGYQYEMMRAMIIDIPLVGVLIVVMVVFAVLIFSDRHDRVQSRGLVGLYSFTCIGLSIFTGYGIMFILGIPITSVAVLIPFIVCGVGLDDTFIITGTYFRLLREGTFENNLEDNSHNDTTITSQQRQRDTTLRIVQATLNEVAVSITMTTITTLLAFLTGGSSQIPAVRWLCWYAAITLFVVYFYQISCFIALLVLDERRVQANRKDLCFWIVVNEDDDDNEEEKSEEEVPQATQGTKEVADATSDISSVVAKSEDEEQEDKGTREVEDESTAKATDQLPEQSKAITDTSKPQPSKHPAKTFPERLMSWYADHLLKPTTKMIVLLIFAVYFAGTVYSTTLLRQEFNIDDYIPEDSHMASSMYAWETYSSYLIHIEVYFRGVDQSDPEVQLQMTNYVQDLAETETVGGDPGFFWLSDFRQLAESNQTKDLIGIDLETLSFNEQVNLALSIPQLRQIYGRDVVRDPESGNITASRCIFFLRDFDPHSVSEQVDFLLEQRDIALRQPVNDESKRTLDGGLNFFSFADLYFYWELFDQVIDELIFNTVLCVAVVSVIAFVLVPHWSAVCYACPLLIMLYFNLMGTMQYCGITINVISYFILVTSIGLLVDFLMHVLLRYYESKGATRDEKVKETLETIGASIFTGAFTTFLGVIPLAFSTTKVFKMTFICFLAMVVLGCAAGLILLPVLLSLTGPVGGDQYDSTSTDGEASEENKGKAIVDRIPERQEIKLEPESEYDEEITV